MSDASYIQEDIHNLIGKQYQISLDLLELGAYAEKVRLFEKIRSLIAEKERIQDDVAVAVLAWAYDRLAE
jgi:hypothetical protein